MRGRVCRCLLPRPRDTTTSGQPPGPDDTSGPATAVIIDRVSDQPSTYPCRIHILLIGPHTVEQPADDQRPHIVVDYLDADGPAIRRIDTLRGR